MRVRSLPIALLVLAACGGEAHDESAENADTTTEPATGAEATEAPETNSGVRTRDDSEIPRAPKPWDELTQEERGAFMADSVLPYMQELFAEYDPDEFANVNCATCHGPNMHERDFEMPSPSLPALHASGTPEQHQMVEEHPRMVRFMFNHVVPAMRTMLREEPFDAETGEGFSCYFCHPRAE